MTRLLEVRNLMVRDAEGAEVLRGVSFDLARGESLAVIGESSAGKSTLALALAGLVPPHRASGSVRLDGRELIGASETTLRTIRGSQVALAIQGTPLNPATTLGAQLVEPLRERAGMTRSQSRQRACELASNVLLDPQLLARYPHQVSGGQRRRAALAMAMALDPALVVLDEPTGGLDPVTAGELIGRVRDLAAERGFGLVVVTHDLSDAHRLAERTMVLYAGAVMESGASSTVIGDPRHPYTWALVNAYPVTSTTKDLRPIRGMPPDARHVPSGCPFHPRCPQAQDVCVEEPVALTSMHGRHLACHLGGLATVLSVRGIGKAFGRGATSRPALADVSLDVHAGEAIGIVGPSGSGKSTLARILTGHLAADHGQIVVSGRPFPHGFSKRERASVQLVMQDPWDALSPRLAVADLVREPLDVLEGRTHGPSDATSQALASVGLPTSAAFLDRRPHELSGGQLQRIALARALVGGPALLVADEPTSMLDPSEQARLMVTLRDRQAQLGLSLVLISHSVALVKKVTDRLVVLDDGRVVETGPTAGVCASPRSRVARRLLDAAPALPVTAPDPDQPLPAIQTTPEERTP